VWLLQLFSLFNISSISSLFKSARQKIRWSLVKNEWLFSHSGHSEWSQSKQYQDAGKWLSETEQTFSLSTNARPFNILECSRLDFRSSTLLNSGREVFDKHWGHLKTLASSISSACLLMQSLQNVWEHCKILGSISVSLHKEHCMSFFRFSRNDSRLVFSIFLFLKIRVTSAISIPKIVFSCFDCIN
jgi:hypothetical protein